MINGGIILVVKVMDALKNKFCKRNNLLKSKY